MIPTRIIAPTNKTYAKIANDDIDDAALCHGPDASRDDFTMAWCCAIHALGGGGGAACVCPQYLHRM